MKTCYQLGPRAKNLLLVPPLIAVLNLIPAGRATAQTFTTLHSFTALIPYSTNINGVRYSNPDGASPYDGLVLSGTTLYGMANRGGSANAFERLRGDESAFLLQLLHVGEGFFAERVPFLLGKDV